jgi:hypothetical protein
MTTAALLALTGLLAACSGAANPAEPVSPSPTPSATVSPSPSASPSPSPEPTVDKPERPTAMDQHDVEGAAAAAEYFLALYNYINRSGDTSEWAEMSHRVCTFCQTALERANEVRKKKLKIDGGEVSSRLVKTYKRDGLTGIFPLDVEVIQQASTTRFPDGSVESSTDKQTGLMRVEMGIRNGEWVVVTVAPKPED